MVFGALALLPFAGLAGGLARPPEFSDAGLASALFLGTFGAAIQFSLFMWALRWLEPSRAVVYLALNPLTAVVLAAALLDDPVTPGMLLGLTLTLAGVAATSWPARHVRPRRA